MILLYAFEGGVKTIVFTDTLQTTCMLVGLVVCIVYVMNHMGHTFSSTMHELNNRGWTKIFNGDPNNKEFWLKNIIGGMFIAKTVGNVLQSTGSYMVPFLIAGSAYFIALAAIQILAPKLEPANIIEMHL